MNADLRAIVVLRGSGESAKEIMAQWAMLTPADRIELLAELNAPRPEVYFQLGYAGVLETI